MAKGSVNDFRPTGIDRRQFFSAKDLDAIIKAAGGLPLSDVDHQQPANDGMALVTVRVPRRIALAERLEAAATAWDIDRQFSTRPSVKQVTEQLKAIEKTCEKLLQQLGLLQKPPADDDDSNVLPVSMLPEALRVRLEQAADDDIGYSGISLPREIRNGEFSRDVDFLNPSGSDLLSDAIVGIYRLRDWSRAAESHAREAELKSSDKRHEGDQALDVLFESLARIWIEIFNKEKLGTSVSSPNKEGEGDGKAGGPLVRFLRACLSPLLHEETPTDGAIRNRIRRLRPSLVKSTLKNT